jgi:energy-coupling factor transport system substrate-specific component
MKQKLNAKDFILIGVLTALMWIICMVISTIMSVAGPVTNVFYPSVVAIPNGIVMMLLLAKVPKKGVFTICAAIQAILFLLVGAFWFIPIGLVIGGIICDFLVMSRNEITMKSMMAAYALFSAIFAFSAICPIKFLQSAFVGAMEKKQYCPGVHSGNVEHYFRSHAGSHCCCRIGGRSDWWLYRSESIEKTLYQSWTCFSKITGSAP